MPPARSPASGTRRPRRSTRRMASDETPMDTRLEIPSVLLRIGTAEAEQVLVDGSAAGRRHPAASRHRLAQQAQSPSPRRPRGLRGDRGAARRGDCRPLPVVSGDRAARGASEERTIRCSKAMRHAMEQELERIFRLMALHVSGRRACTTPMSASARRIPSSAPTRSSSSTARSSRSCGRCSCRCSIRTVTTEERVALANRFVGAPLETPEQAVATMLASEDVWLRSCGIYAIGALRLRELEPALDQIRGVRPTPC